MQQSAHNILSPLPDSEQYLLVNLLSKQADLLDAQEAELLKSGAVPDGSEWISKGYVVDPAEEAQRFKRAYLDSLDARDTDEVQLFYVGSYACNFDCSYCYQTEYEAPSQSEQDAVQAAFFAYVDQTFAGRRKYVTLFGGEPLLPGPGARRLVEQMVEGTRARGLDLAVVTNGYHLASYVPLLSQGNIREVQVTLDGPAPVHDARRYLIGGAPTFASIVEGIDAALAAGLAINLRSVLDRDNLEAFVELAAFARSKGWTSHPRFKTQIGRNYELHVCQTDRQRLYSRLELFQDLYGVLRRHPEVLEFHRPAYSIARFLADNGELPSPLFDSCPATKTEWAFDYTGHVYSCTATVGKQAEALGTFWPTVQLERDAIEPWEERDVLSIPECRDCNRRLACGGGCGSVAKNRTGRILSADCRPVEHLIGLGAALYQLGEP